MVAAFQAVGGLLSVFMLELVPKLFALRFNEVICRGSHNLIDAIIVVVSFVVMVLDTLFRPANSMMLLRRAAGLRLVRLCRRGSRSLGSLGGKRRPSSPTRSVRHAGAHFLPEDSRREALRAARRRCA